MKVTGLITRSGLITRRCTTPLKYITLFTVEGRGAFPTDMLRYNTCFPDSSVDVGNIDGTEHRKVVLVIYHPYTKAPITPKRWESFGWSVRELSK